MPEVKSWAPARRTGTRHKQGWRAGGAGGAGADEGGGGGGLGVVAVVR